MMLKCKKILSLIMVFVMLSAVIALSAVAVHAEDKNPNTDPTVPIMMMNILMISLMGPDGLKAFLTFSIGSRLRQTETGRRSAW